MDSSLRNGLPSSSALLQNMQTMANMGAPPAAGMNPFNAQQQHMLHQYHLSMMQQGMNPFFNNPMMLPPGKHLQTQPINMIGAFACSEKQSHLLGWLQSPSPACFSFGKHNQHMGAGA